MPRSHKKRKRNTKKQRARKTSQLSISSTRRLFDSADLKPFEKYNWLQLAKLFLGYPIYGYQFFYRIKKGIFPKSGNCLNWGFWPNGIDTDDPCGKLVLRTVEALKLEKNAVVVEVGSGLGGSAERMAKHPKIKKIIGINICSEQVAYAMAEVERQGLKDKIIHRVLDATNMSSLLLSEGVIDVVAIESLAEIPKFESVLRECHDLLPPGGRIALCDVVTTTLSDSSLLNRLFGRLLQAVTGVIFQDNWRTVEAYTTALRTAGFDRIEVQNIGDRVFQAFCEHAKPRLDSLKNDPGISATARFLANLNVYALDLLSARHLIDYVIISARRELEKEPQEKESAKKSTAEAKPSYGQFFANATRNAANAITEGFSHSCTVL